MPGVEIPEMKQTTFPELEHQCIQQLRIKTSDWNWLNPEQSNNKGIKEKKECALDQAIELMSTTSDINTRLMLASLISQYANEKTPWSNKTLTDKATRIPKELVEPLLPQLILSLRPKLLSASPKTTKDRSPRAAKNGGMRPTLGHSTISSELEKKRQCWKNSEDLYTIGSACFLMRYDTSPTSVSIMAAFALNVLDDSDPEFRTQGCHLVNKLIDYGHMPALKNLGIYQLFKEEIRMCFSFLPRLTPGKVSLRLLQAAYPVMIRLLDEALKTEGLRKLPRTYLPYLEILDENILGLIRHIEGHSEGASNLLKEYLLRFAAALIDEKVGPVFLCCFSRLNFMMCRLITDPFLIDSENGPLVVEAALALQQVALMQTKEVQKGSCELILDYKYDFLAAWVVFLKRAFKYGVGTEASRKTVLANVNLLKEIANCSKAASKQLALDMIAIVEQNPDISVYI